MDKRAFLKNLTLLGISASALPSFDSMAESMSSISHLTPEEAAKDEDFWASIRDGYKLKPDYINLENGYYCFQPQEVLE